MRKKSILAAFFSVVIFLHVLPTHVLAASEEPSFPSVTVINPIRGPQLGLENADLLKSLKGQWDATESEHIPATWLWQYSALEQKPLVEFAKTEMKDQEFGIFLEIDKNSAERAGVTYHSEGPWYFSDGLLLVSYEQFEREKLIDKSFTTFKETFGYYPKTVGAWWVGAESIRYMQRKYGITAVLQCADQFSTDKYSLWGTPWSIPYAPSKRNAAIPASSQRDRIPNVVILQWATRDPVMAYGDDVEDSKYSIQDKGEVPYVDYLKNIFLHKPLDHIAIGLESGLSPESYATYHKQMQALKNWKQEGKIVLQKTSAYANDFNKKQILLPPTAYFLTTGYHTTDQAFWYNSSAYRFAIQKKNDTIYVIDVRDYFATPTEEYFSLPNTQSMIRINTIATTDTIRFPSEKILLGTSDKPLVLKEESKAVSLYTGEKLLAQFTPTQVNYYPASYDKKTITYFRHGNPPLGGIFLIFIIVYVCCIIFLYRKETSHSAISIFCLILLLIALYPIYTSGQFVDDSMRFTTYSLSLLPYITFLHIHPSLKIALILQVLPLLLLLLFHFFLTKSVKKIPMQMLSLIVIIGILFFYDTFNNYFLQLKDFFIVGKKAKLLIILSIFTVGILLFVLYRLYRSKKYTILHYALILISLSFVWVAQKQLFAEKTFIVTPFELSALDTIYTRQKPVIYIEPELPTITYQRIWPLLTQDKIYAEALTAVSWETLQVKDAEKAFARNNTLIFIPRYLGTDFYSTEDKKGNSIKIFDNGQIGVVEAL